MPLHLSVLLGNNVLLQKDERGGKWFCNVSARRGSSWKMRWGICDYEELLVFQHRMAFCLILVALPCLLSLTMRNVKGEFLHLCIVKFHFKPGSVFIWKACILFFKVLSIGFGLFLTDWIWHDRDLRKVWRLFTFGSNLFRIFHVWRKQFKKRS